MGAACLAMVVAAGPSLLDPRVLIATAMLSGALLLGALVIALVDRWRKRQTNVVAETRDQLALYRALYERGELSKEEFERIRDELTKPLRPPAKPRPPAAAAPPAPEAGDSPPASDSGSEPAS